MSCATFFLMNLSWRKMNDKKTEAARSGRLLLATNSGNLEKVKELVDKGVSVDAKNDYGWTTLHFAVYGGYLDIVKFLIEKGAEVNAMIGICLLTKVGVKCQKY